MQLSNRITNNINHTIKTVQANINNSFFSNISIEILNDDCIENILSNLDNKQDLINCKLLNKRFCYIIENIGFLYYQLYLEKNCLSPQAFLSLPKNYIISIERELKDTSIKRARKHISMTENNMHSKKKLFYSIEKNFSNSKKIEFQTVKTITYHDKITTTCFSDDNSLFAIGSYDIVKIFAFTTTGSYQLLYKLKYIVPNLLDTRINKILFSPDNAYIITSSAYFHRIWYKSIEGYIKIKNITNSPYSKIYFKNDSRKLFIESNKYSQTLNIVVFDLNEHRCKKILSVYDNKLQDIFNVRNGSFKNNVDLNPSIKNDSWLCFMLQKYAICSICTNAHYDYGDLAFVAYIKDMIHENNWLNSDISSIMSSNDMKLICITNWKTPCSILAYTNNKWQLKVKFNSTGKISCFSQDNQRIITNYSYFEESKVIIWNIAGKKAYKELILNYTNKAKFSPNSKYIIASHLDNKVTIWQLVDNAWRLKSSIQYAERINDVYFSNYNWMIVTLLNEEATILKAISCDENKNVVTSLTNNKKIVCNQDIKILKADNIFFDTDSNYFAIIKGYKVQFWDYNTDKTKPVAIFQCPEKIITNILFSPDKSHIIISADFYVTIYSFIKNKCHKSITIETQEKNFVYLKNDGKKIIIAEITGSIKVLKLVDNNWQQDLIINKITDALDIQNGIFINTELIMQFNDNWLNSILQIYAIIEIAYNRKHNNFSKFTEQVNNILYTKVQKECLFFNLFKPNISFSKDNKLMYLCFDNKNCVILEHNNNQWSKKLIFDGGVSKACFSQDNQRIITIPNEYEDNINRLIIWNITADTAYQELGLNNISSANFSPDGTQILTTSTEDNQVKIWSLLDDRWQFQQAIPNNDTPCFANFTDDAKIIYIVFNNKKVKIINISYTE